MSMNMLEFCPGTQYVFV
ncbi:Protein of unknown function, partial [Gryllus bimaculatus]